MMKKILKVFLILVIIVAAAFGILLLGRLNNNLVKNKIKENIKKITYQTESTFDSQSFRRYYGDGSR